ncbi:MFS transporter [Streptomyces sp. AM 2-1-1]|uniref:MFS transporter n=1 Tax=Streptomyces sp. AM 2-1-1 TaxID=3028709 RepID=UPI0023B93553|nr:MFS transporter [Streptomyces sp. AM 2-1-1]WEH38209.1 MFS transporter [Streptomyces sp. AM 2-1-1]
MPEDATRNGVFAALRVRDYRIYWSTGLVSNTGSAMQGVALDWFVFDLTHSGTAVGWAAGLQFAPVLLFGLWGGVLADRYDRRTLLLWAQSLYAVQAVLLTVLVVSGHAPLWSLYLLSFGLGTVFTVENPARLSFVTELVGGALIPNAAGLNILSLNAARLVGPAIAGVLIAVIGAGGVFAVNALSFAAVTAGLLMIRPRASGAGAPAAGAERSDGVAGGTGAEGGNLPPRTKRAPLRGAGVEGLRYVAARPELTGVLVLFGLVSTFAVNFPTTLTLFAGRVFDVGSSGLGFMSTALSVGTIAGTLAATRRASPRVRTVVAGAVLFGASEAVAALMPSYTTFLILLLPTGFTLMILNTAVSAFVQSEVGDAVRGRVMAVYTVVSMGGAPLGGPAVGWVSQHAGVRWGLASGAGAAVLAAGAVALWLSRRGATVPGRASRVRAAARAAPFRTPATIPPGAPSPPPDPSLPSAYADPSVPRTTSTGGIPHD